jgi:hypothetical protein
MCESTLARGETLKDRTSPNQSVEEMHMKSWKGTVSAAVFLCITVTKVIACKGPDLPPEPAPAAAADSNTVIGRFPAPPGAQRVAVDEGSFGAWLREMKLRPRGTLARYFNGKLTKQDNVAAVIDFDVGKRDLQQCADAVMRLRAEYHWSQNNPKSACFVAVSGKLLRFGGGKYGKFRSWLDHVYNVANTGSLRRQLESVADGTQVQPGDVYVMGASAARKYGHAVIVLDVAIGADQQRWVLLAQSFMPAQDIHVLKNDQEPNRLNWFRANADGSVYTPGWGFDPKSLRRFGVQDCGR